MSDHESTLADISTTYSTTCHIDRLPKQSTRAETFDLHSIVVDMDDDNM